MTDREYFKALCRADMESVHFRESIGTYSEKRLHRILKKCVTENEDAYEVSIGRYIADVCENGKIYEIQTRAFERLLPKLRYYLDNTEYEICVVCPIIRNKKIFRIDPETGEILRKATSPKHGKIADALPMLFRIREIMPSDRLKIRVMLIDAEEYRYSEKMRYRREGAYDSETFPCELVDEREFSAREDFYEFLPPERESFTAAEYAKYIGQKGRDTYSTLNFLAALGLIKIEKNGRKYVYKKELQ